MADQPILFVHKSVDLPENATVLGCRLWKKSADEIRSFLGHAALLDKAANFHAIILCVDHRLDEGQTASLLAELHHEMMDKVVLISVDGPEDEKNWTRMLNGCLRYLLNQGVTGGYFMPISFEARVDTRTVFNLITAMDSSQCFPLLTARHPNSRYAKESVISASANLLLEAIHAGRDITDDLWRIAQNTNRNTCMLWRFEQLISIGGFDPRCNEQGGQEDFHAWLRLCKLHSLRNTMAKVLRYADPRLAAAQAEAQDVQESKRQAERNALQWALQDVKSRDSVVVESPDFDLTK